MAHDLIDGDPHLIRLYRTEAVCMCWGPCCNGEGRKCICPECDCADIEARYKKEYLENVAAEAEIVELRLPEYDHACGDCGKEVFRNGTRGRFPSRCPECKEKA